MVASKNSALDAVESGYLKRYTCALTADQKIVNITLMPKVSDYAYLPFLLAAGNSISLIGITGTIIGNTVSTDGVTSETLLGYPIDVKAIKESGKIRIKCTCPNTQLPVSVFSLRSEGCIDSISGATS